MKHLFLEGPIQTGKSTLILECLREMQMLPRLGGFCSIRLLDEDGEAVAYRLSGPETDFREESYAPDLPDVFLERRKEAPIKHLDVFDNAGLRLLADTRDRDLILLDEIGGIELLCERFRKRLYEVLDGNVPCLGVIKQNEKTRFLSEALYHADTDGSAGTKTGAVRLAELNLRLHQDLEQRFAAETIYYDPLHRDEEKQKIKEYICGNYMTD